MRGLDLKQLDICSVVPIYTVKLYDAVWLGTGVIVFVAVATKTRIIQNALGKIKGQGYSYGYTPYYGYGYGYAPSLVRQPDFRPIIGDMSSYGFDPLIQEPYPSQILSSYNPVGQQQQGEPLISEPYPSHILHQYIPPRHQPHAVQQHHEEEEKQPVTPPPFDNYADYKRNVASQPPPPPAQQYPLPNQHLCTGERKSGTCDSQGFCIDSGCGSVIRGGSQCKQRKHKKNNIHPTTPEENRQYHQYPEYPAASPSSSGQGGGARGNYAGDIDKVTKDPYGDNADPNGCYSGRRTSGPNVWTCRNVIGEQRSKMNMQDYLHGSGNYKIVGHYTLGDDMHQTGGGDSTVITTGGSGSHNPGDSDDRYGGYHGSINIGFHNKNGKMFASVEHWPDMKGGKGTYICSDDSSDHPLLGACGAPEGIVPTNDDGSGHETAYNTQGTLTAQHYNGQWTAYVNGTPAFSL